MLRGMDHLGKPSLFVLVQQVFAMGATSLLYCCIVETGKSHDSSKAAALDETLNPTQPQSIPILILILTIILGPDRHAHYGKTWVKRVPAEQESEA